MPKYKTALNFHIRVLREVKGFCKIMPLVNRGYYFFEVNTKYISSSAVKNQNFSRVRSTSENADIFTTRD